MSDFRKDVTPNEAAKYIADLAAQLATIADEAGLCILAATLRTVANQAEEAPDRPQDATVVPFKQRP